MVRLEVQKRCFKCGSSNVGPLFDVRYDEGGEHIYNHATGKEEFNERHYQVHYDCWCCSDCKAWDFPDPDLWYRYSVVGSWTCPRCGGHQLAVTYNDFLQDTFEAQCTHCREAFEFPKPLPEGSSIDLFG